jgi:diguanylate cyclase (GGDEF)-like protein
MTYDVFAPWVSIGAAVSPDQNRDLAGLLMAADRALYSAKASGRNRVQYIRANSEAGSRA